MSDKNKTIDPFSSDSIDTPETQTTSIGLAVPMPLSSADLEMKYGNARHDDIEALWPILFEDADGHIDPLTEHDLAALRHLKVSPEEFYLIELERVGHE